MFLGAKTVKSIFEGHGGIDVSKPEITCKSHPCARRVPIAVASAVC
eukprot:COSAG06_NODE_16636_length_989_cov_1.560674_2_plen_45_part_01